MYVTFVCLYVSQSNSQGLKIGKAIWWGGEPTNTSVVITLVAVLMWYVIQEGSRIITF
jgi:hypothetical protein